MMAFASQFDGDHGVTELMRATTGGTETYSAEPNCGVLALPYVLDLIVTVNVGYEFVPSFINFAVQ